MERESKPTGKRTNAPAPTLTTQQRHILRLYAAGHTHQAIGDLLGLSKQSVSRVLLRIKEKFKIEAKSGLIALALREGLLGE